MHQNFLKSTREKQANIKIAREYEYLFRKCGNMMEKVPHWDA